MMQVVDKQCDDEHANRANRDGNDEVEALPLRGWVGCAGYECCGASGLRNSTQRLITFCSSRLQHA